MQGDSTYRIQTRLTTKSWIWAGICGARLFCSVFGLPDNTGPGSFEENRLIKKCAQAFLKSISHVQSEKAQASPSRAFAIAGDPDVPESCLLQLRANREGTGLRRRPMGSNAQVPASLGISLHELRCSDKEFKVLWAAEAPAAATFVSRAGFVLIFGGSQGRSPRRVQGLYSHRFTQQFPRQTKNVRWPSIAWASNSRAYRYNECLPRTLLGLGCPLSRMGATAQDRASYVT